VAVHLRKSLAKRKWRKAYNATAAIRQMQMLRVSSAKVSSSGQPSTSTHPQRQFQSASVSGSRTGGGNFL